MNWQEKNEGWETYQLKEIKDPYPNQPNGKKKKKIHTCLIQWKLLTQSGYLMTEILLSFGVQE